MLFQLMAICFFAPIAVALVLYPIHWLLDRLTALEEVAAKSTILLKLNDYPNFRTDLREGDVVRFVINKYNPYQSIFRGDPTQVIVGQVRFDKEKLQFYVEADKTYPKLIILPGTKVKLIT